MFFSQRYSVGGWHAVGSVGGAVYEAGRGEGTRLTLYPFARQSWLVRASGRWLCLVLAWGDAGGSGILVELRGPEQRFIRSLRFVCLLASRFQGIPMKSFPNVSSSWKSTFKMPRHGFTHVHRITFLEVNMESAPKRAEGGQPVGTRPFCESLGSPETAASGLPAR